jgi:RNA polymerase sigma-70 factor (ECF subfamily)
MEIDEHPTSAAFPLGASARPPSIDVCELHRSHAGLVWKALQRLGVRDADLEDMMQEVFVVVHRRLPTLSRSENVTAWIFGISVKVAAAYRRRAHVRRERLDPAQSEGESRDQGPEPVAEARQALARLETILDRMDPDKRAVFVMFEIDELSCEEIAATLNVAVGTVYSRLHAARKVFEKALARLRLQDARETRETEEP